MAASFNKVILLGNLTRDPEMRVTPNGVSICKFGLAVNRVFTTKDGERREDTTFVDCDAFGRQAETISKYMSKGQSILVEGRLRLDQWEDRNSGEKRSRLGVVVENFQFTGGRDSSGGSGGGGSGAHDTSGGGPNYEENAPRPRNAGPKQDGPGSGDAADEDIPF